MKTFKLLLGVAFLSIAVWSCKNEVSPEIKTVEVETTEVKKQIDPNAVLAKAEFNIEGMTCAIGCAKTIEKKLANMEGVKSARVNFDKKLAMVEYDEAKVTTTSLEETVKGAGKSYSVNGMKTVESFSSDGAKAGNDTKKCNHEGKECKKGMKGSCKMGDKASCKGKSMKECKMMKGKKMAACKKDCKKACCTEKA